MIARRNRQRLLLDRYPGAVAAYSLKKLRRDYRGPCIRLRKRVGGAADYHADFGFRFGELDWEAVQRWLNGTDDGLPADGGEGRVAVWYSQISTAGSIMDNTVANNQPTIDPPDKAIRFTPTAVNSGQGLQDISGRVEITIGDTFSTFETFSQVTPDNVNYPAIAGSAGINNFTNDNSFRIGGYTSYGMMFSNPNNPSSNIGFRGPSFLSYIRYNAYNTAAFFVERTGNNNFDNNFRLNEANLDYVPTGQGIVQDPSIIARFPGFSNMNIGARQVNNDNYHNKKTKDYFVFKNLSRKNYDVFYDELFGTL